MTFSPLFPVRRRETGGEDCPSSHTQPNFYNTGKHFSNRIHSFSIGSHSFISYSLYNTVGAGLHSSIVFPVWAALNRNCSRPSLALSFSVPPRHKEQGSGNAIKGARRCAIDCSRLSATLSYQRVSPISRRSMPSFPSSAALRHRRWKCHKGFVETLYQMMGRLENKAP